MPIQSIYLPDVYPGDNIQVDFAFTHRILAKTDLIVIKETIATGVQVTLELDTDYTIPNLAVDDDDGGEITMAVAPADTERIWIFRHTARTQLINITEGSPFPSAVVTKNFDRICMMIQELDEAVGRALGLVQKAVAVAGDAETLAIVFDTAMENADYNVLFMTPDWMTSCAPSLKTTAGFLITFANPAPAAGGILVYGVSP